MIDVFEEWVRHDIGAVYVQMLDSTLANFCGEPGGLCFYAETCGQQLVLEHNGDLYPATTTSNPTTSSATSRRHMLNLASPRQRSFEG
jgi:uncharacterized protein